MTFLVLIYAQYRAASYDSRVAIGERREHRFEVSPTVESDLKRFLDVGAVQCGATLHRRRLISTHMEEPFAPCLLPRREVVPLYEND